MDRRQYWCSIEIEGLSRWSLEAQALQKGPGSQLKLPWSYNSYCRLFYLHVRSESPFCVCFQEPQAPYLTLREVHIGDSESRQTIQSRASSFKPSRVHFTLEGFYGYFNPRPTHSSSRQSWLSVHSLEDVGLTDPGVYCGLKCLKVH